MKFNSIKEAINYRQSCPSCKSKLYEYQARDALICSDTPIAYVSGSDFVSGLNHDNAKIYCNLNKASQAIIDITNSSVKIIDVKINKEIKLKSLHGVRTNFDFIRRCFLCEFDINISFHIDPMLGLIDDIRLISEKICYKPYHQKYVFTIENNYPKDMTQLDYYPKDNYGDVKFIKVNLVNLDFENINNSINRIKKLALFL